jgi:hypothetical protein
LTAQPMAAANMRRCSRPTTDATPGTPKAPSANRSSRPVNAPTSLRSTAPWPPVVRIARAVPC